MHLLQNLSINVSSKFHAIRYYLVLQKLFVTIPLSRDTHAETSANYAFFTLCIRLPHPPYDDAFNPLTPRSDHYMNSSNYFNTMSSKQVTRIKRIINYGLLFEYNTKFSGPANKEMYGHQLGELAFRSCVRFCKVSKELWPGL